MVILKSRRVTYRRVIAGEVNKPVCLALEKGALNSRFGGGLLSLWSNRQLYNGWA